VLRLRTTNPAASRLYESLGFTPSTASECTHVIDLRSHVSEVPQS
jgi:predicted GNAT family acetyltransferase